MSATAAPGISVDHVDLGLRIPIAGVQLIEASAGTGKTFTLATLYSRLIIETGLPVTAVLAVTFTEAATKQLRERLRARLVLAQSLVEHALESDSSLPEEERLTRQLVREAIMREGAASLRRRLRLAAAQMDLAPIHTIHGFCRRALSDHSLEAGQPLLERELIENEAVLREEVALEFWRLHSRNVSGAELLEALWKSPQRLAASLRGLLALDVLLPPPPPADDGAATAALDVARAQLGQQFDAHGAHARELLREASASSSVNALLVKDAVVDAVWLALQAWAQGSREADPAGGFKWGDYASARLREKTNKNKTTPVSPLFDAIETWQARVADVGHVARGQQIAMVHRARDFACARLRSLKRERKLLGFDDMIAGVADALAGIGGNLFAQRLQAQYAVALLDEFQDTDARQWAIFHRLFAGPAEADALQPRALFLIGDPKQAIYRFRGGDVFTYLAADKSADARHRLQRNFRSRPLVLRATQALFELSGDDAFAQPGIAFESVQPGGDCHDHDLLLDAQVAPALTVLVLAPQAADEAIEIVREHATRACVDSIHRLLAAGLAGRAQRVDRDGIRRGIVPGDIAVLVEKNDDAERIHQALSRAGIPSVAAGRCSLYETGEAQHLCWLFEALLAPADDERLRAALASPLFGLDAVALLAMDSDEAAQRLWQDRLQRWQQRTRRFGPMALLGELCAGNAPRLLRLRDGERRLSNYLQLGEELQAADAHALGLAGLLAELERRIARADSNNDGELLRLESDAARVRILTLHKSKGLEFDLVFLPYAATNGANGRSCVPPMAQYHDGTRRVAELFPETTGVGCLQEAAEVRAEKMRLLYVGLTRARLATWIVWGEARDAQRTPLAWLLHREPGAAAAAKVTTNTIAERLALLHERIPEAMAIQLATPPTQWPRLRFAGIQDPPAAAIARRALHRDWWVYSFSQLAREDTGSDAGRADDELADWPDAEYSRFSGSRFGNALHEALENIHFERWLDCEGPMPPAGELEALTSALRAHGYSGINDLDEGVPLLTKLISETVNVTLPEGTRLAQLPTQQRRNELEFHLAMAPTSVARILALLHRFGVVSARQAFGFRQRLEGLLTGRIDLVYAFEGRYFVLDYKSNRLRDYAAPGLVAAVADNEYDLQYVLYSLALHRWLRFRLGEGYDITRHLGGVRYLFCRGLDRQQAQSSGIHAVSLPPALIEQLDALLRGEPA